MDSSSPLHIAGTPIRTLEASDNETYLGVSIGSRLLFPPACSLQSNLIKVTDSDLAPWQKLEVFRSYLHPSISHHLATGRVEKSFLTELYRSSAYFFRQLANGTYRRVGGLGASRLTEDADVWTIARAAQLLDSNDTVVRLVARAQASKNISVALKVEPTTELLSHYLRITDRRSLHKTTSPRSGCHYHRTTHHH